MFFCWVWAILSLLPEDQLDTYNGFESLCSLPSRIFFPSAMESVFSYQRWKDKFECGRWNIDLFKKSLFEMNILQIAVAVRCTHNDSATKKFGLFCGATIFDINFTSFFFVSEGMKYWKEIHDSVGFDSIWSN